LLTSPRSTQGTSIAITPAKTGRKAGGKNKKRKLADVAGDDPAAGDDGAEYGGEFAEGEAGQIVLREASNQGGSERKGPKRVRKGSKETIGETIIFGKVTKSAVVLAQLWGKTRRERYQQGQRTWRRDGKIAKDYIDQLLDAVDPETKEPIIPIEHRCLVVDKYDGWVKQRELGDVVVHRKGNARRHAPKAMEDTRDRTSNQFMKVDEDEKLPGNLAYWTAQDNVINNGLTRHAIPKIKGKKIRDERAKVAKQVEENVGVRAENAR
jgi:hypothetical protein